jgi:gluconate 2-dehydrogenase gamma chain
MMPDDISRRAVIVSAALVPVAALTTSAQTPSTPSALSDPQLRLLAAIVDRIIPKDDLGPSASECDVPVYINRALADYLAGEKPAFIEGLESTDALARRTHNVAFIDLTAEQRDAVLASMDNGTAEGFANARGFFNRARRLAMEGMFGDPYYGGNKNFAGWELIRYPGPRMATTAADQRMGVDISPYHHSAYGSSGNGTPGGEHGH